MACGMKPGGVGPDAAVTLLSARRQQAGQFVAGVFDDHVGLLKTSFKLLPLTSFISSLARVPPEPLLMGLNNVR